MTKQQFIERINKIEAFSEERREIGNTLCSLLEDGELFFGFDFATVTDIIVNLCKSL